MNTLAMRAQRGVVLFIALIVLVAMSLAGVGMIRSVDTSLGIAGNLAFKQGTTHGAELGVQAAYTWLSNANVATLNSTDPTVGYISARPATEPNWFDIASWQDAATPNGTAPDAAGNVVRYVIHRMCTERDTPYNGLNAGVPNQCALYSGKPPGGGPGAGGGQQHNAQNFQGGAPHVYYRVTARVDGPRNTVSIIQVSILIQA